VNNHNQDHYKHHDVEPIDIIEMYKLNFNLGNCIKYILRAEYKDQKQSDLEKAIYYLERELKKV
jgi:hypothetical protein